MSGIEDSDQSNTRPVSPEAVLGPVAAKGPKRFGAMPDLSKIPAGARERLAQFVQDGPEWGASSTDARSLRSSASADDVALDLGPLGSPTPVHQPHHADAQSRTTEETVTDQGSGPLFSNADGHDFLDDADRDGQSNTGAGTTVPVAPTSAHSISEFTPDEEDLDGDSVEYDEEGNLILGDQIIRAEPLSDVPESEAGSEIDDESPISSAHPTSSTDIESGVAGQSSQAVAPAPRIDPAPIEEWNDGIPLPDEPDFFWDDAPYPDDLASASPEFPSPQVTEQPHKIVANHGSPSSPVSSQDLRVAAEQHLKRLVGRDDAALRQDQWTAIEALVMNRSRALVVQRTGWGKSAVYFVATSLLRAQGDGPTIIISPLLALMRDQISAAERAGIKAATINSANVTEWEEIEGRINAGEIDVLLCSPERLNNPSFRDDVLPRLARDAGLVVIDEAHCISDWGHDFRPDYRRIRTLLQELRPGIPVLATTATANERVSADIAEQLSVTADGSLDNVIVLRGALDRESLHLAVVHLADSPTRVAWIIDALKNLQGSGIVYCLTVSAAHEVSEQLRSAGLNVAAYTGRTDPDERAALESQLKSNEVKALIATSALGMGFDKPDLAFVIHLGAPNSPIAYYQQVGRAGRGVAQASSILLPGKEDRDIWEYFGSLAFPSEPQVREVLSLLDAAASNGMGPVSVPQLESRVELKRSRLEMMLKVLDVDGAVKRVQRGWISTGQPWHYDRDRYSRVEAARIAEQNSMLQYAATSACRIKYLREALDDPDLAPDFRCGRCDNCGGISFPATVTKDALAITNDSIAQPGIEVAPRKMWPTNMAALGLNISGKIGPSELAQPGKAIARIDGLGWSTDLREALNAKTADGETPVRLRTAAAEVLRSWPQMRDIEGVVSVRSLTRPLMVDHLARGLAQYLGRPYIGAIGPIADEPPTRHDVNSAMRLAGVSKRLQLELSQGALSGLPNRKILLIDDYTESGWTLTVAARLLRQAGASEVYPFVLAQY